MLTQENSKTAQSPYPPLEATLSTLFFLPLKVERSTETPRIALYTGVPSLPNPDKGPRSEGQWPGQTHPTDDMKIMLRPSVSQALCEEQTPLQELYRNPELPDFIPVTA